MRFTCRLDLPKAEIHLMPMDIQAFKPGVRELFDAQSMAVASEQPPWEVGFAVPGAQLHRSLSETDPDPLKLFLSFSDDSNFRASNDRRITFSSLPLKPLPAMEDVPLGQPDRASCRNAEVFPFRRRAQSPRGVKRWMRFSTTHKSRRGGKPAAGRHHVCPTGRSHRITFQQQ